MYNDKKLVIKILIYILFILVFSLINLILVNYALKIFISYFKQICIDIPNKRSLHNFPIPTSAGIIVILCSVVSYLCLFFILQKTPYLDKDFFLISEIIILCLPLVICGFLDDLYDLNEKKKFFAQSLTAILLIQALNIIYLPFNIFLNFLVLFILFIFIIGNINMINFMDGIDGLIGGSFSFIFLILAFKLNLYFLPISLGLVGFLFWNWSPAKIFLGDSGSTFLGAFYSAVILSADTYKDSLSLFLLISPLFLDAIICFFRRLFIGSNVFKAHKEHLYQRLVQNGLSHKLVSITYITSIFFISIFYILDNLFLELSAVLGILLIGIYLEKNYAIEFNKN